MLPRHRAAGGAGRADAGRQRPAQPGHVRDHLDGAAGRPADGRVPRQEHDRQGRVPADRGARVSAASTSCRPVARASRQRTATGCSTTGSSEACMLGGMALLWRWRARRRRRRAAAASPNLVMGANVQVCWEKFCRYWQVEPRLVPMEPGRLHLPAPRPRPRCDENTIGVVAILGSTFDGSYEPVAEISAALDKLAGRRRPGRADPRGRAPPAGSSRRSCSPTWSGTSGCRGWPRSTPPGTSTAWSTRASAGWCGGTPSALPEDLVFKVNYLGGEMPTFALNFSRLRRPGGRAVLQLPAARLRGLPAGPAGLPGRRDAPVGRDRRDGPVRAAHRRQRPAGVRVPAPRRRRPGTACSTCPSGCARAAGWCPPTRSRRT